MKRANSQPCPCGSGRPYPQCCAPMHLGAAAPDAESLMRSRYSAHALRLNDYLRSSCHASTRPQHIDLGDGAAATKWMGLEIKRHETRGEDSAIVEFVARYKVGGRAGRLHEVSRFVRENGHWYYLDAENNPTA